MKYFAPKLHCSAALRTFGVTVTQAYRVDTSLAGWRSWTEMANSQDASDDMLCDKASGGKGVPFTSAVKA